MVSVFAGLECQVGREHALNMCDSLLVEDLSVVRGKGERMDGKGETTLASASDSRIGKFFFLLLLIHIATIFSSIIRSDSVE